MTLDPGILQDPQPGVDVLADCAREKIKLRPTGCDWRFLAGDYLKQPPWQIRPLTRIARRIANAIGMEPTIGWANAAYRACKSLQPDEVDMVLATAPPYAGFNVGATVAHRLGVPLVLDYRDLWSLNPHYKRYATNKMRDMEANLLGIAQGVTVVSPSMAALVRSEFHFNKPIEVVTNGFDNEEFDDIKPEKFDDFAVVYAGRFYPPGRTAKPLVTAVAQANVGGKPKHPVRLHYFGSDGVHVEGAAAELGAGPWVVNHGNVPRKKVLAALMGAGAAAVITTVEATATKAELGILTGKLFEAMGARVPILLISPPTSDASRVVRENNLGRAFAGSEAMAMASWLVQLCNAKPHVSGHAEKFSWPQISAKLDAFLRDILAQTQVNVGK